MAKKRLTSITKRSRTRSGCLTCRDRHVKCDEQHPVCKNCIKSKRKCYRGIRLNFTQYTIYNPDEFTSNKGLGTEDGKHGKKASRILDQSITIASLYKNGRKSYQPFLHLHSPEDSRESDLQYEKDLYSSLPSITTHLPKITKVENPWTFQFERVNHLDVPYNKAILENQEITNYLLNDSNSNYMDTSSSYNILGPPPPVTNPFVDITNYNVHIDQFINLIQNQKYFWILDLFNDLNIWKLVVPNYCLNMPEASAELHYGGFPTSERAGSKLLIDCLMQCSVDNLSNDLTTILSNQLNHWYEVRNLELNVHTFHKFERLLVTIVLILLRHLIKLEKNFPIDKTSTLIINNQLKIFNKLMVMFSQSDTKFKSIIFISSIHSVSILKFLILKQMAGIGQRNNPNINQLFSHNYNPISDVEDVNEDITYNLTHLINQNKSFANEIQHLSKFEILNLDSSYKSLNLSQFNFNLPYSMAPQILQSTQLKYPSSSSDSSNLKIHHRSTISIPTLSTKSSYSNISLSSQTPIEMSPTSDDEKFMYKSEAFKLREHIWYLLKLDYSTKFRNNNSFELFHNNPSTVPHGIKPLRLINENKPLLSENTRPDIFTNSLSGELILPNERGIATIILSQYINKLANIGDENVKETSNSNIRFIFQVINNSMIDQGIKNHWNESFSWTYND